MDRELQEGRETAQELENAGQATGLDGFRSVPALIGLHQKGQTLIKALVQDESAHIACKELNEAACQAYL